MDVLDLARWQFGITTVYHFLFVPISIGMSALVAGFHTAWVRTHNPQWYRMTKFLGKLFLINFALGVVTGIVQEFQFGMNWSDYSRFVGDIFGAPLALEALLTFFLESTFIGLWMFGWGRLPEKLHAATMWLVHIGTAMSAFFIIAANSFMQNPVGYRFNPDTDRAELTDFLAVITNPVQLTAYPHALLASYMTGGMVVMAVCVYHLHRKYSEPRAKLDRPMYRKAASVGAVVTLVASLGVVITGDLLGKVMTDVQPMKMAAAEALYETTEGAPLSIFSTGDLQGENAKHWLSIPGVYSFMGKGSFSAEIEGIYDIREQLQAQHTGDPRAEDPTGTYTPYVPVSYWTFRAMMGLGFLGTGLSLLVLWATRANAKEGTFRPKAWVALAVIMPFTPVIANSVGWIFAEMGRQPWVVYGLMNVGAGVSPGVTFAEVAISLAVFTLLYGALAVVELWLFIKYTKLGAEVVGDPLEPAESDDEVAFAY